MLCLNKNNTDSSSVAPVRYPVVQISSKLHVMRQNKEQWKPQEEKQKGHKPTGGQQETEGGGSRKRWTGSRQRWPSLSGWTSVNVSEKRKETTCRLEMRDAARVHVTVLKHKVYAPETATKRDDGIAIGRRLSTFFFFCPTWISKMLPASSEN